MCTLTVKVAVYFCFLLCKSPSWNLSFFTGSTSLFYILYLNRFLPLCTAMKEPNIGRERDGKYIINRGRKQIREIRHGQTRLSDEFIYFVKSGMKKT